MQRSCISCGGAFDVRDEDLKFYETVTPSFNGKSFPIPPPVHCPPCRLQRRMSFRNERSLYQRKSDLTGREILSTVAPDSPYKIYDQDEWWSDRWNALDYGRQFDPQRKLTEQLHDLNIVVPHPSLNTTNVENSTYTNYALGARNCYLVFGVTNAEDCLYGKFVSGCKNVVDCLSLYSCEWCYEGVGSQHCHGCLFFSFCRNSSDCAFVEDCVSCKDCLLSFGLRNKQYCILNEQLDRATYEERKSELFGIFTHETLARLQEEFARFAMTKPHRASHIYASEGSSGEMVLNSKNCHECFDITDGEDCAYIAFTPHGLTAQDCCFTAPEGVQFCYECISALGQRCVGNYLSWWCNDTYYSIDCHNSQNLFACVGLHRKQYCILNVQYTKEEYEVLAARIAEHMQRAGEWGSFLPITLSQFAYNETIAHEYFPLEKAQALSKGWRWRDEPHKQAQGKAAKTLPSSIRDVSDDLLKETILCELSGRPYKLIPQELAFLRRMGLPPPRRHPDERHRDRLRRKNPYRLWSRKCGKCGCPVRTNVDPERGEIIYCEACHMKEVY